MALIVGGVVGTFVQVPFLSVWTVLMGMFVYRTASLELAHARLDAAFGDRTVGEVMTPDPETIRGWMTVQAYADELLTAPARHRALPVLGWDGTIVGVVTMDRLARVPVEQRASIRVQDVAFPMTMVPVAGPAEQLLASAARFGPGDVGVLLVFEAGRLAGIVTASDLHRPGRPVAPTAAV